MPDTRLILHVAGTDAQTQELPKEAVKTAIAHGDLSYSQLIWSPDQQSWKQVRELPELLPAETVILHVKGTESQTREMPRQAVRKAVSRGEITRSQLIWSAPDSAWKPLRELPDFAPEAAAATPVPVPVPVPVATLPPEAAAPVAEPSAAPAVEPSVAAATPAAGPQPEPEERLILHVKGTESDTRELPREQVRKAISRGEITDSQLIWRPGVGAWKPVRELPELQPGETMILHVKGTESETRELPKPAIRAAISRGEISQSQLIWSPLDSAWKPIGAMPDLQPGESLVLHVKGTESQTTELPKKAIRTAISKGQITHSQLIWSAAENRWKQVREMPELLPSQKLAPAPVRRQPTEPAVPEQTAPPVGLVIPPKPKPRPAVVGPPRVKIAVPAESAPAGRVPTVNLPLIKTGAEGSGVVPKVKAAHTGEPVPVPRAATPAAGSAPVPAPRPAVAVPRTAAAPMAAPISAAMPAGGLNASHVVKEKDGGGSHPLKWICIGLGAFILLIVAANYFVVDQRLEGALAQTTYANIPVYAHYGAFIQPNVIVIHIPATDKLTPDTVVPFLVALAHSTPDNMLTNDLFQRVALTSGWTAQYSFSGYSWKELGDMKSASDAERKEFIMAQISDASGQPLTPESTLSQPMQDTQRERAWKEFIGHFTKP